MTIPENSGETAVENTRYNDIVSTIAEEEPEAPAPKEVEVAQEEANEEEPQEDGEKPKEKKGGFTRKLAAKDARIAELEAQVADKQPKVETQPTGKPKLDDFETWDAYIEATAQWTVEQKLGERDSKSKEQAMRNELKKRAETYVTKADKFAESNPDFDKLINECDALGAPMLVQAIQDSDIGPEVAYYLAKNPDEAESIASMGVVAMNKALGKIEAKLELSKESKTSVKTSNAPAPIKPVSGRSSGMDLYTPDLDQDDYLRLRRQRKS